LNLNLKPWQELPSDLPLENLLSSVALSFPQPINSRPQALNPKLHTLNSQPFSQELASDLPLEKLISKSERLTTFFFCVTRELSVE
jgi:hypothetical protein